MFWIVLIICCFYIWGIFKIIGGIIDFIHSLSSSEDFRLAFIYPSLVYGFIMVIFLYGFLISCELLIFIGVFLFIGICLWIYIVNRRKYKVKYEKINNLSEMEDSIDNGLSYIRCCNYVIEYVDEFEFRKRERALKKYNMLAYKKLIFEYYPNFRKGNFTGTIVRQNKIEGIDEYELMLPTDSMFAKVYGDILLHYTVYYNKCIVMLKTITPDDILNKGLREEFATYKGVPISKSHGDSDIFKIDLLNMLKK